MPQSVDINLILWPYEGDLKRNPGKQSLKYELYIDGRRYYEKTPYHLFPNQFNKEKQEIVNHEAAKFYNAIVRKRLNYYRDEIQKKVLLDEEVTPEILESKSKKGGFFEFCKVVRPDDVTKSMIYRLTAFLGSEPTFKQLTIDFLRKYEQWHKDEEYGHNTLHQSMKYLRRICNQATDENYIRKNPFEIYKMPEYIQPETIFLNEFERDRFFNLLLKYRERYSKIRNPIYDDKYKTLVYFMLACFTGFRHSDWGKFDPAERVQEDNKIRLRTHKNKQWVVLPMGPSVEIIVNEINKVGPFTVNNSDTNDLLRILAEEAQVNKELTSHVGRHSFGYLCASLGFSEEDAAYFMGISIETVKVYYHLTGEIRKDRTKQLAEV